MQRAFFSQKLQQKPTHLLFPCTFNHDGARTQTHLGSLWVCFSLRLVCVEACVRVKNVRLVWTRDLRCVFTPQAASKRIFCPFFFISSHPPPPPPHLPPPSVLALLLSLSLQPCMCGFRWCFNTSSSYHFNYTHTLGALCHLCWIVWPSVSVGTKRQIT